MPTFQQMQDRINSDYLDRTDLSAETTRALIRAVKHYEKQRFWFNLTATALAIGTASVTVSLPSNFLGYDFATVADSGNDNILTLRSFDRIAYNNQANPTGVPTEISYWRDQLYFSPMPSSATTITLHYTHSLNQLSAGTDTNAWTSAGEDLIIFHAYHDILTNVLRISDKQLVESVKTQEMEAFQILQFGNDLRQGSGLEGYTPGDQQGQSPKTPHKSPSQ